MQKYINMPHMQTKGTNQMCVYTSIPLTLTHGNRSLKNWINKFTALQFLTLAFNVIVTDGCVIVMKCYCVNPSLMVIQ